MPKQQTDALLVRIILAMDDDYSFDKRTDEYLRLQEYLRRYPCITPNSYRALLSSIRSAGFPLVHEPHSMIFKLPRQVINQLNIPMLRSYIEDAPNRIGILLSEELSVVKYQYVRYDLPTALYCAEEYRSHIHAKQKGVPHKSMRNRRLALEEHFQSIHLYDYLASFLYDKFFTNHNERTTFLSIYANDEADDAADANTPFFRPPHSVFLQFYPAGIISGAPRHRDRVGFATIVISLTADESDDTSLHFYPAEPSSTVPTHATMTTGSMVIFNRFDHEVPVCTRQRDRLTLNIFY